ncbi:PQQ enzyme repeat-containing protein [Krasilnikoviella flava]|uniref:PQQ enzyme repeat-containing protein n=2 Tax=Krasilnikoviella flava TaxID=526729 RepID=A0A1T5J6K5_9MICO|nr:PQQ enzyme repeat-containing protein [Krasilnikoviella flava]
MATFELVPDDEREDEPFLAPDGDEPGGRRPLADLRDRALARWRSLSRRGRVTLAAGTAVVVAAAATAAVGPGLLDARADRLRAEAVQGLPGVVGDLSEPLGETWELANGHGTLVTLPGGIVLTTQGTSVSALDAATGEELWQRDVGPYPACGPQGSSRDDPGTPADTAVCLSGESDDRTVTVLDATGVVLGERSLGPARTDAFDEAAPDGAPVVVPAAAGAIAVVEGSTNATAPWPADDMPDEDTLRALRADGWVDPTLRLEDALTGEVRGEATVRLRAQDLGECGMTQDEDAAPELMTDPMVDASPSVTSLSVCSASVLVTPDGAVLDVGPDGAWVRPIPGGGHVLVSEESTVIDEDGSVVATVPGFLLPPLVDDDPEGPFLVLVGTGDAEGELRLTAVGPDGAEEWSTPTDDLGGVLARVAGVVVVQDGGGLVGIDVATGAEVWARRDLLERAADGSGDWVTGAVTDGTRLLVGISGSGERHRLVALDLRDGTTVWERERRGYLEGLQSIGGHVVAFDGAVHGLG